MAESSSKIAWDIPTAPKQRDESKIKNEQARRKAKDPSVPFSLPSDNNLPTKRKVIFHFIRHAQAGNNIKAAGQIMPIDPGLTPAGMEQATNLQSKISARIENASLVLVSPLHRTLHTTFLAVHPSLAAGTKIIAYPELRERGAGPGATGSPRREVKKDCEDMGYVLEWDLVPEGWEGRPNHKWRRERARRVRRELFLLGKELLRDGKGRWKGIDVEGKKNADGDVEVVVVSHGNFLKALTIHADGDCFYNAECRSYVFDEISSETSWLSPLEEFGSRDRGIEGKTATDAWNPGNWYGSLFIAMAYMVDQFWARFETLSLRLGELV